MSRELHGKRFARCQRDGCEQPIQPLRKWLCRGEERFVVARIEQHRTETRMEQQTRERREGNAAKASAALRHAFGMRAMANYEQVKAEPRRHDRACSNCLAHAAVRRMPSASGTRGV